MSSGAIRLNQVGRSFGGKRVLRNIDLTIHAGESVVIRGANGAGKTTLLRILSTLLPPSEGKISFYEQDSDIDLPSLRKKMGVLLTEGFLYNDFTVVENLLFYASLYDILEPLNIVRTWLQRFALSRLGDELVRNLSRGERQKTALIRALFHDPSIVLLDEPTAGLDSASQEALVALLKERKGKITMVCTTHDPSFLTQACDRMLELREGRIA